MFIMHVFPKILAILICSLGFSSVSYANSDCPYRLSQLKENPYSKVKAFSQVDGCSNFDLFSELSYKIKINRLLATHYRDLTLDDFDMGEAIDHRHFDDIGIFTTYYWQKNQVYKNQQLKIFIAYDVQKDQSLIVSLNTEDDQVYIIGDLNYILLDHIIQHAAFDRMYLVDNPDFANLYKISRQRQY